ncbi:MAG: chorismate mutase [Chloroflexota bacterium]|nr:MAG: chorismate mutase [Chloroflexota bacterium]
MRAIRGAITVENNTEEAIERATCELLRELARRNKLGNHEIVSVLFTLTPDLNAAFPARAARHMGWDVPMLDMQEIAVPDAIPRCLRTLIHVNRRDPVRHVYLGEAMSLRPDLGEDV